MHRALSAPDRPVGAVVGGAKVSTKLSVLENLVKQVDVLVLGGGMANTFLLAAGQDVGASLVEADMTDTASAIAASAAKHGCQLVLPVDQVSGGFQHVAAAGWTTLDGVDPRKCVRR